MVESILDLFKIHGKMILGNPAVIVQNMLRKTPKPLDAVDVIFGLLADHCFRVVHGKMFAQSLQGVVPPKGIGVVDRALSGFLSNNCHQFFLGYMLHHPL
jgi:hypothetical protein